MTSEERLARMLGGAHGGGNTVLRHYIHGPSVSGSHGGVIGARSGAVATNNPFRFSTKYVDEETRLVYYGYRHYYSHAAKWLSRDPLAATESLSPYRFVANNPIDKYDYLGLRECPDVTSELKLTGFACDGCFAFDIEMGAIIRVIKQWNATACKCETIDARLVSVDRFELFEVGHFLLTCCFKPKGWFRVCVSFGVENFCVTDRAFPQL